MSTEKLALTNLQGRWIGPDDGLAVGVVGFLILRSNNNDRSERYVLSDWPAQTNVSREPRLTGWCGETNNVSTHAEGLVRVERMARNGRAYVVQLAGADLRAALEELGYPELAPGEAAT
jgi:hypothetical protein